MGPLRFRPQGTSDGVTFPEKGVDDVDGGEAVRAGDEDFTSWGDGWHGFSLVETGVCVKLRDLRYELGEGIRYKESQPFYISRFSISTLLIAEWYNHWQCNNLSSCPCLQLPLSG